jgi:hypothetical protein
MSDTTTKAEAELLKVLPEPIRDAQSELNRKTRPLPKRTAKTNKKNVRASFVRESFRIRLKWKLFQIRLAFEDPRSRAFDKRYNWKPHGKSIWARWAYRLTQSHEATAFTE